MEGGFESDMWNHLAIRWRHTWLRHPIPQNLDLSSHRVASHLQ